MTPTRSESAEHERVAGGGSFVLHDMRRGVEGGHVSQNDRNDININIRAAHIPSAETRRAAPVRISQGRAASAVTSQHARVRPEMTSTGDGSE